MKMYIGFCFLTRCNQKNWSRPTVVYGTYLNTFFKANTTALTDEENCKE